MGTRESYEHGVFPWVDMAAAREFYEALFGWTTGDVDTQGGTFTMIQLNEIDD